MSVSELDVKRLRHCASCTCNSALSAQDKVFEFFDGGSLEQIDAELIRLDALVRRLRFKRNKLQPVSRLSPDILMIIFRLVQEAERELGNPFQEYFSADGTFPEGAICDDADIARYQEPRRGGWLYVSSAWYSFATQAPSLWSTLSLDQPMFLNKIAVKHSQGLPLNVHIRLDDHENYFLELDWKAILTDNAFRLRTIDISGLGPDVEETLSCCLIPYMPNLRTLQLTAIHTSGKYRMAGKIEAPNLHRLVLRNMYITLHLPLLQTSVALSILELTIDGRFSLTFDAFRNLIACFRALECLSIHWENDHSRISNPGTLSLPNLSRMHISHGAPGCLALLKLFDVPDSCRRDVRCEFITPFSFETLLSIRQMLFASAKPNLTIRTGGNVFVRFQTRKGRLTLLPVVMRPDASWKDKITELQPLFTSFPVTRLSVRDSKTHWARRHNPLNALQLLTALACGESDHPVLPELASLRLIYVSSNRQSVGEIAAAAARVLQSSTDKKYEEIHNMRELIIQDFSEVGATACGLVDLKPMGVKLTWDRSMMEKDNDDEELI